MLNFEVDPTVLAPYVPKGTELDDSDGSAATAQGSSQFGIQLRNSLRTAPGTTGTPPSAVAGPPKVAMQPPKAANVPAGPGAAANTGASPPHSSKALQPPAPVAALRPPAGAGKPALPTGPRPSVPPAVEDAASSSARASASGAVASVAASTTASARASATAVLSANAGGAGAVRTSKPILAPKPNLSSAHSRSPPLSPPSSHATAAAPRGAEPALKPKPVLPPRPAAMQRTVVRPAPAPEVGAGSEVLVGRRHLPHAPLLPGPGPRTLRAER